MFRRTVGQGSLYRLGLRDATGTHLDDAHASRLTVPLPVPAGLFWSVTAYDARTRSEVDTPRAGPRSARCSTSSAPTLPTPSTCTSAPPNRTVPTAAGSRPSPAGAGSRPSPAGAGSPTEAGGGRHPGPSRLAPGWRLRCWW
ncbi:DUF1214 domain-containing protein [Kitasatospora sp. NPDC088391]|uniref:DUF1214 domain-containing protein n=1 Tax=Kitasatospora sp. NPDC088391 TaxID=3364074 RepID=UPI003829D3AE